MHDPETGCSFSIFVTGSWIDISKASLCLWIGIETDRFAQLHHVVLFEKHGLILTFVLRDG